MDCLTSTRPRGSKKDFGKYITDARITDKGEETEDTNGFSFAYTDTGITFPTAKSSTPTSQTIPRRITGGNSLLDEINFGIASPLRF